LQQEGVHFVTLATWAQKATRLDVLLQIIPALAPYYDITGLLADRIAIGQVGLEYARLTANLKSVIFIEIHVLAPVLDIQGHYEPAEQLLLDALDIANQNGYIVWHCAALLRYSQMLRHHKALGQALDRCQQALQLADSLDASQKSLMQANIQYELGKIATSRQDWQSAQSHFLAARDGFSQNDSNPETSLEQTWGVLSYLGLVTHQLGDLAAAAQMYKQALDIGRESGTQGYVAILFLRLANLEEQCGNHAAALEYAREALEWSRKLGMVKEQAQADAIVGRLGDETAEPLRI
jgi:tetratricopeptide (TPR) repeat protein